ncbi:hypothetical protein SAMN05444008_102378 [Cnuella takakiae]|uniref:Bacteriophage lambda head decoration protein D n=1 Tax=Cnuella takakiae TaxID=1302690 RepID=A0A1M4VTE1_9BACT|nr:hypothetical protein [Cnuella takakiae]OLY92502.1 hypothetical protein BUE76_11840 [Cnuella takakiae]SHE72304.1 hypothetical protein SAMN05444008_102378 [Cnuella takakiae]
MGLQPVKTTFSSGVPVWQKVDQTAQGGFVLDTTGLTLGNTIAAGTAIVIDEATRKAKPTTADTDTPAGLLYEDVKIEVGATLDVVIAGTIYARRGPAVSAALKAKMPRITFSNSF